MHEYAQHVIWYYAKKYGAYSKQHQWAIWAYYVKPDYAKW